MSAETQYDKELREFYANALKKTEHQIKNLEIKLDALCRTKETVKKLIDDLAKIKGGVK